jgi:hypothetical protein
MMTAFTDSRDHPRAFIRHNLLTLSPVLNNPAPALVRADGTVLVKLTFNAPA